MNEKVIWRPYARFTDFIIEGESAYGLNPCYWEELEELHTGLARTPLIHFEIIEYQMPDRVSKKFYDDCEVPEPVDIEYTKSIRKEEEATSRFDPVDPIDLRADEISKWDSWQVENLKNDDLDDAFNCFFEITSPCTFEDYRNWFIRITRKRMVRPSTKTDKYQNRHVYDQHMGLDIVSILI